MHVAGHKLRPPLHTLERWLVGAACVHLLFLPWAFGSTRAWSQLTSLALSSITLIIALIPRRYEAYELPFATSREGAAVGGNAKVGDASTVVLHTWSRLLKFPLFWLGLGLLALVLTQGLNPWWTFQRSDTHWWLSRNSEVAWLPAGIDTPWERFNVWRQMVIYASSLMTVWALWIGLTRRRSLQIILGTVGASALVIAVVGFVHQMSGESKLLWIMEFPGATSFGTFVYRNHGGAYLGLAASIALGLAVWHFFEARRRMARSSPAALWFIAAIILAFSVLFSFSRGAVVTFVVFALAAGIAFLIAKASVSVPSTTPRLVTALVVLAILGTLGWVVRRVDFSQISWRMRTLSSMEQDSSFTSRMLAYEGAQQMLADHWVRGVGAGGFRFLFPMYIKDKPDIYQGGRLFWEHAHNDWLQIPIELGIAGVVLIAAAFAWAVIYWWRLGGWRHPLAVMLVLGCSQTLMHAAMDFPFQCPAVLVTWWALIVLSIRWLELERR